MHRRALIVVLGIAGAVLLPAVPALAPHVAQLNVEPQRVAAGEEVTVWGPRGYGPTNPVEIRLDAPDGPVLATFDPDDQFFAAFAAGPVRIPADVEPGRHVLFATQDLEPNESYIRGLPARAVIQVTAPGAAGTAAGAPVIEADPVPYAVEQRPAGVTVEESGAGTGALLAVAAGVAVVVGLAGAGLARVLARRPRAPRGARE